MFISHTGKDEKGGEFAEALYHQLRQCRIAAFFDKYSLHEGEVWQPRITDAARRCRVFVAVISPTYVKRKWPMLELHLALRHRLRADRHVVPVLLDVTSKQLEEPPADWRACWQQFSASPIAVSDCPGVEFTPESIAQNLRELLQIWQRIGLQDHSKGALIELAAKVAREGCKGCEPSW